MADDQGRCSICSFCLFEFDPSLVSLAHLHHRSALFGQASDILFSPYLVLFPIILICFPEFSSCRRCQLTYRNGGIPDGNAVSYRVGFPITNMRLSQDRLRGRNV